MSRLVKGAAQRGEHEVLALRFPRAYCTDGGRAIKFRTGLAADVDRFAKKAHAFYDKELAPQGYKVRTEIMGFPGGMPGDVGLFLR